jgi:hypothetical protein
MDADAGLVGALVGAGFAAIELAVAEDALAGGDFAATSLAGAFYGFGHWVPQIELSGAKTSSSTRKAGFSDSRSPPARLTGDLECGVVFQVAIARVK